MADIVIPAQPVSMAGPVPPTSEDTRSSRTSRPPRPNFKHIHRFPLPVNVHPVPPVIPHNPLSIISVALSYLTFLISPPRQEVYTAYFDSATSSVHVTDERAIKALWEMGFFGKGSLSRSEPSWLEREKKRRGLLGGNTSEEATRRRRSERRELKLERARSEKLLIEERLKAEAAAREAGTTLDGTASTNSLVDITATSAEKFSVKKALEAKHREFLLRATQNGDASSSSTSPSTPSNDKSVRFSPVLQERKVAPLSDVHEAEMDVVFENEEHLQLSNEESFFLAYGLGVLRVVDRENNAAISTSSLFNLFCHHSYYPPRTTSEALKPDDPFMISYVVYHHFRSLGWVVRSGVKFGTDYLLYNRGPVFSHAEFAVIIVPSYGSPYWQETEERRAHAASQQSRTWWWLHCVNRVQAQVKKTLVICYVEVPPPAESLDDLGVLLGRYQVREFLLRRWVPNRTRD